MALEMSVPSRSKAKMVGFTRNFLMGAYDNLAPSNRGCLSREPTGTHSCEPVGTLGRDPTSPDQHRGNGTAPAPSYQVAKFTKALAIPWPVSRLATRSLSMDPGALISINNTALKAQWTAMKCDRRR